MNLFKKAAVFTDIHVGLKSNSVVHNNDCDQFIDWFVTTAKAEGCETCFFLGDWHNHRASINVQTLQYSLRLLEKLSGAFSQVFFIPGNHDLYFRDKRDVHSVEWAKHLPNITIVNDWFKQGDVVIAPWLVADDFKKLQKKSGKYLFGHLELPSFYMNSLVEMPDHGDINVSHLTGFDSVFSGHFHKRQAKNNVWYIGNAFPHNFSDVNDDARGMMVLEWGVDPVFHSWPGQPRFREYTLSQVLDNPAGMLLPNSYVRVNLDIDISFEEAAFIKETLMGKHSVREMTLIPIKNNALAGAEATGEIKFEPVDKIILDQITTIQSEFYDPKLLLEIYNRL